jgi:hypothetical protein
MNFACEQMHILLIVIHGGKHEKKKSQRNTGIHYLSRRISGKK